MERHRVPKTRCPAPCRLCKLILSHIGHFDLGAAVADVKKSFTGALTGGPT